MQAKHLLHHVQGPNAQLQCFNLTQGPRLAQCRQLRKTHRSIDEDCLMLLFSWTISNQCLGELDCLCTDLRRDKWSTLCCSRLCRIPGAAGGVCQLRP